MKEDTSAVGVDEGGGRRYEGLEKKDLHGSDHRKKNKTG